MKFLFTLSLFSLLSLTAWAQNGTIDGQVVDVKTNEAIIGANVVIEGTTVGAATDIEGKFTIANVKPGTYNVVITYIAYKSQTVTDVVVESGKKTTLKVTLVEDIAELAEVVVTAQKEISNDVSLLNTIKENKLVVSGISAQQMTKLPDRDAAQVMMRVPGITVQDGRFVLVRGMPERYNQVLINGIIGPSTEIDKRSFSFDLIPAGSLDQMLVYKSGTAEMPGDFAGGVIQMVTKSPAYEEFISVGLSAGVRTNTTFQDFKFNASNGTDNFGFDNGFRDMPGNFPTTAALQATNRSSQLRLDAGKTLANNFALNNKKAGPDMGFNFATSQNGKIGNVGLSNLTSVAYSRSFTHYNSEFLRYQDFTTTDPTKRFDYSDNVYSNDVRINVMHNWLININDRNKIEFKNLFVQLGEDKTTTRVGTEFGQRNGQDMQNYAYYHLNRSIYTGQLDGKHTLGDGSYKLNWVVGMNYINRNEPDYRRFRTFRDKSLAGTEAPFEVLLPPSGNPFEAGRFWSKLQDKGFSHGLNLERKFGDVSSKRAPVVKAGYFLERKTRTFDARYVNYIIPNLGQDLEQAYALARLPLDQVFASQNIKPEGFTIEEATKPQDHYSGENTLSAGYVSTQLPLGKFDVNIGMRAEYNVQNLDAIGSDGTPLRVNNPVFAPLPSFNVAYNTSDRSLIRLAYSRTINRPEFRELAPFLFYQFEFESALIGNPRLKTAFIHNVDLRWEMYPNPGETISIGTFYKQLKDPIELYLQVTSDVPQLVYNNSASAYDYGLEVEFRKSLASLGVSRFLRNTSFNVNASWIKSQVDIGANAGGNLARYRPLQGQSPYIINAGVYYSDEDNGFSANAAFNVFGPRIYSVGDINFPTFWEMPRKALDLQVSKRIGKTLSLKLNAQNLLNTPFRILQDSNQDQEIKSSDLLIQKYKVGSQFSLSLNWMFAKE
ncbi:MAG TPA: outer membrane beta-barrel protein [Cyclobacteriaceae bacterium]|nr:outer membrane beta-barrel protein [Cyclobacteriaceae bacterium]